jgi:hypothetical protein
MTDRWIQELRQELGIDAEVDVDRLLDVARAAAHKVERKAAPITTYLMGLAIGMAGPASFDRVAASVEKLISEWSKDESAP